MFIVDSVGIVCGEEKEECGGGRGGIQLVSPPSRFPGYPSGGANDIRVSVGHVYVLVPPLC